MTLDEWSDEEIDNMIEVGGNSSANAIYEAHLEGSVKPSPDSSHEERMHFIRYIVSPRNLDLLVNDINKWMVAYAFAPLGPSMSCKNF